MKTIEIFVRKCTFNASLVSKLNWIIYEAEGDGEWIRLKEKVSS
jgi:hypothetical protein